MAMIDIRDTSEEITEIKFSDEEIITNSLTLINISDDDDATFSIYKSDIPNLIAALNKAKDLGWY